MGRGTVYAARRGLSQQCGLQSMLPARQVVGMLLLASPRFALAAETCDIEVPVVPVEKVDPLTTCIEGWSADTTYSYPFASPNVGIQNGVLKFCIDASMDLRVVFSNGIPNHDVTQDSENNMPCKVPYRLELPLYPQYSATITEATLYDWVGIAVNGVSLRHQIPTHECSSSQSPLQPHTSTAPRHRAAGGQVFEFGRVRVAGPALWTRRHK